MASRLLDQNAAYRDDEGVICAGGSLTFSVTGTSTPKNVYTDSTLGTSLGPSVDLDASGRAEVDVWLAADALYRVVLKDASANVIWTRDSVGDANVGGLVPLDPADGDADDVYSTDGINALWRPIREVADPSGHPFCLIPRPAWAAPVNP